MYSEMTSQIEDVVAELVFSQMSWIVTSSETDNHLLMNFLQFSVSLMLRPEMSLPGMDSMEAGP